MPQATPAAGGRSQKGRPCPDLARTMYGLAKAINLSILGGLLTHLVSSCVTRSPAAVAFHEPRGPYRPSPYQVEWVGIRQSSG